MQTTTGQRRLVLPLYGTPADPDALTLGAELAETARHLGREFTPWQRYVADVAHEYDLVPNQVTGEQEIRLRYDDVCYLVPRQSGKTFLGFTKLTYRCSPFSRVHGAQTTTYTAQTGKQARKKLERDLAQKLLRPRRRWWPEVAHSRARPVRPTEWRLSMNNGSEHILFGTNSYIQIEPPSDTASHGDTLDEGHIDEAFAHADGAVEGALQPAMITRPNHQLWVYSTAGNTISKYLWGRVLAGRRLAESGERTRSLYMEWGVPDDAPWDDEDVWWQYLPALGWTIQLDDLRALKVKAINEGPDAIARFRRSYLNQWAEGVPVLDQVFDPVIPQTNWTEAGPQTDDDGFVQYSFLLEPVAMAADSSPDRQWSTLAFAGQNAEGQEHGEVIDRRPGVSWLVDAIKERHKRWRTTGSVAIDPASPAGSIIADLEAAGITVTKVGPRDQAQACGALYDAILEGRWRHRDQPELNTALLSAKKRPIGPKGAWAWDKHPGGGDISPLVAVTLATWLYRKGATPIPPPATGNTAPPAPGTSNDLYRPSGRLNL